MRRKYLAAGFFVLLFIVGRYAVAPFTDALYWWADICWTVASLLAGVECLRAAPTVSGDQRRAWYFFAGGCFAWFTGMLIWDYQELVLREITPFPDLSTLGFMALAPLFVAGFMHISHPRGINLTLKEISDLGVIVTVVAFGSWLVLAEYLRNDGLSPLYRGTAVALPVLSLSAFLFALLTLLRHATQPGRIVLLLFLASLGLHASTDSIYAYSLLEGTYQAGHYIDTFWIVAFALTYSAAATQRHRSAGSTGAEDLQGFNVRMRRADTLVFTGTLLLVGLIAYWHRDNLAHGPALTALFLAVLAGFLGLREWANHRIQMQLMAETRASEHELARILENLDDTYYRTELSGAIVRISSSVRKLLGYAPHELLGRPVSDIYTDTAARTRLLADLEANNGVLYNYEVQLVRRDGGRVWVSTNAHYIRDANGAVIGIEGTSRDISERKAAEDEMRKLSSALAQSADAVLITDAQGVIEYVNPAFEEITGFEFAQVVNTTPRFLKSGRHEPSYYARMWSTIRAGKVFRDVMINRRMDQTIYYEDKTITPLLDRRGGITHFVSTGKDISKQIQAQEHLQYIAHHDTLTGLPNRALFLDRAQRVLASSRRHDRLAAVLFMDLDQFKNINDSLGHELGDKLLTALARRLESAVRPGDTVARFGGDEFVVLLDDLDSYNDITHVVEKLRTELTTPVVADELSLHVTATIGISVYPNDGSDGPTLLKNADNAMYRAKESGRDTYAFYSEDMSTRVNKRLTMETRLRKAVDRSEFELHYQPQLDIVKKRIIGVEALLRWHPASGESTGPAEFVPLLEDTGLIIPVGEWVLRTACAQVRAWNRDTGRTLGLAVNISARQFTDSRFGEVVQRIAEESGLPPASLQLEMTEGVYLQTTDTNYATVHAINRSGIKLAIDDFGTGYSALNYLKRWPIDVLKIDRSFIRDVPVDADDSALTIAALAMARGLGLRVIAEGVENQAQLDFLVANDCRYAQGYLFSRPLPAPELGELLEDPGFPAP